MIINGITLIALVITIIVLLILAGVSIAMLTGDNGVLTQAQNAKNQTERSTIIENAKVDILEIISENNGETISRKQLKTILDEYLQNVPDMTDMEVDDILNMTLTTLSKYGDYTIKISEIYNGELAEEAKKITFTVNGKTLTAVEGQTWYEFATDETNLEDVNISALEQWPLKRIIVESYLANGENGMIRIYRSSGGDTEFGYNKKSEDIKIASTDFSNIRLAIAVSPTLYDSDGNIQYCNTQIIQGEQYTM